MRKGRSGGLILIYILLVCTFLFGKFQGGFIAWFLFYTCLVLAVYETLVFWYSLRNFAIHRELSSERLSAGDSLWVRISYRRHSRWPLSWLLLRDVSDVMEFAERGEAETLLFPSFSREGRHQYIIRYLPRGRHRFSQLELESGDLFGLVRMCDVVPIEDEVLVYPRVRSVHTWQTVNERNIGSSFAITRSDEEITSVVGVRDYTSGDRLNRIDWKATARGQGLKVKEFEHHVTNDLMLVLDQRQVAFDQEEESDRFERAVSLAASLAYYAIERRFTIGLVSCGIRRKVLSLGRSQNHLFRLLEYLAEVKIGGRGSLSETILQEAVYLPRGTTLVIITPLLDESLTRAISELVLRKIKVELFWIRESGQLEGRLNQLWGQLNTIGVKIWPVIHDDFEQVFKGGIHHGAST